MSEKTMNRTGETPPGDDGQDFRAAIEAASLAPLWERFTDGQPTEPSALPPYLWRWESLSRMADRAAKEVPMDQVERRVLTLANPHMKGPVPATSINMVGAIQILLPGETARPHRHSANALRFVIEGGGAETMVNGKPCPMGEGDLIITPDWSWHAHLHGGDSRIVWFDALDIPLWRHMNAAFFEAGPPPNLPAQMPDSAFATGGLVPERDGDGDPPPHSPMFCYPWRSVLGALKAMPAQADGSRKLRYTNPHSGGPAMTLTDCFVLALARDRDTTPYRTTSNGICVVAEGEGTSRVGEHEISWGKNDIFTLPNWNWISHRAASDGAKLFMVTDRDALARLGMLRDETRK